MRLNGVCPYLMWPLSMVYRLGVYIHKNIVSSNNVDVPVISVGNITVGGTGKTPAVLNILETLRPDILKAVVMRGYKRKTKGIVVVTSEDYNKFGDEAPLIKKRNPKIIIVLSADRFKGAEVAVKNGAEIIILDDGFQSYEIKRDLDIVVVDCTRPFGGGYLLPAGALREPLKSLRRADCVLLTRYNLVDEDEVKGIEIKLKKINNRLRIFHAIERIKNFKELSGSRSVPPDFFKDKKVICFTGIGNPEGFYNLLKSSGAVIVRKIFKRDHYEWKDVEISDIAKEAIASRCEVLTTEKDAVRIQNFVMDCWVMSLRLEIKESSEWRNFINEIKK